MGGILDQLMASGGGEAPPSIPDPELGASDAPGPAAAPDAPALSEVETLKNLVGLADDYKGIPTVTEQERAQMEKVTTILQTLLASNEKMSDQMTGSTPALRKAFGAGG